MDGQQLSIIIIILIISITIIIITSLIIADILKINNITTTSGVNVNTVNNGSWFPITILSMSVIIFIGCVVSLTLTFFVNDVDLTYEYENKHRDKLKETNFNKQKEILTGNSTGKASGNKKVTFVPNKK